MADRHPYFPGSGPLFQMINHLRSSFPPEVTSDTLKKLGIAPNNESRIINILKFIEIIDNEGKRTEKGQKIFSQHNDSDFQQEFSKAVKTAYQDLFELHGDSSWELNSDQLISYFRQNDHTSAQVGKYQATTFQALSSLAGHIEISVQTENSNKTNGRKTNRAKTKSTPKEPAKEKVDVKYENAKKDIGLTVRIEINLPGIPPKKWTPDYADFRADSSS